MYKDDENLETNNLYKEKEIEEWTKPDQLRLLNI